MSEVSFRDDFDESAIDWGKVMHAAGLPAAAEWSDAATATPLKDIREFIGAAARVQLPYNGPRWLLALTNELFRWAGTPYVPGQAEAGVAADCIGFGAGVYDTLYRYDPPPPLPRHAGDVAWHNRREAAKTTLAIRNRWPDVYTVWSRHERRRRGKTKARPLTADLLEPGDALVVAVGNFAPGHMMIVGPRAHTVWHADHNAGVVFTGAGQWLSRVIRVWRSASRENWGR